MKTDVNHIHLSEQFTNFKKAVYYAKLPIMLLFVLITAVQNQFALHLSYSLSILFLKTFVLKPLVNYKFKIYYIETCSDAFT